MPVNIRVPELGESILEATVGKWLKSEGDQVQAGDPLVELETEKVNVEVAADESGILQRIDRTEGDTVKVGDVLGVIGEGAPALPRQPALAETAEALASRAEQGQSVSIAASEKPASPTARRVAGELGVDLASVEGTGHGGRIMKQDVVKQVDRRGEADQSQPSPVETAAATAAAPVAPQQAGDRPEQRIQMSRRRQTIARRLVEAKQTAAMLTTFNEIDLSGVMELRKQRKEQFQQRYGVGLGFMSFFTRAVVGALRAVPQLNSEIQRDQMVIKQYYDIGIAVDTEGGLVVPVLRDADKKTFAEIEREIADLATRARDGKLTLAELQGGTFTITNGGVFGSLLSTPILNYPQVGILGMHRIEERPVAIGGQVVIRPMMYVAVTYDHRAVDGRQAVTFLVRVKEFLEDPLKLLLEG